jgi:uncharacterized damage-inducible protein DinB
MNQFFADYLGRLESLHQNLKDSLAGLDQAGLDWMPGRGMNSLCVLVVHVVGAQRYWIGDVIAGEPSGRDRDAEFRARGFSSEALIERLDACLAYTAKVLESLSLEDLGKSCTSPRDGHIQTVGWALVHILAHTGIHAGHAQIGRELWEKRISN